MLNKKASFNKFEKSETTQNMFSDHSGIKPEISIQSTTRKLTAWKINNEFQNKPKVKEEILVAITK